MTPPAVPFVPGLELSAAFYREAVRPALDARYPGLRHSAALIGWGSDVLGFDTPQSMDHNWGPRPLIFLDDADAESTAAEIERALRHDLPREFRGCPVDMAHAGSGHALPHDGLTNHRVTVQGVRTFFVQNLGFDPEQPMTPTDWLIAPQQMLRSLTSGGVFYDGLGRLEPIRAALAYYPRGVWLYLLAAQWQRISQEEHFMGRCAQVGDELGSRLVAARLVRDLMRLWFLMERQYAPYIKWFGTAFARLDAGGRLLPTLQAVLAAETWQARETHLSAAYEAAARRHNSLGITEPLPAEVSPFFDRPFKVIWGERFSEAIRAAITDADVLALPPHVGGIDQVADSTDVLSYPEVFARLRGVYG